MITKSLSHAKYNENYNVNFELSSFINPTRFIEYFNFAAKFRWTPHKHKKTI